MRSLTSWSSDHLSRVSTMDQLHRDLIRLIDRLSVSKDSEFANGYKMLVAKMEQVFQEEQRWMEAIDAPSLKVHQEQHARVLGALHNVHTYVMQGKLTLGREVVTNLLPQWFAFHVSTMDKPLALAMQKHQARIAWSRNACNTAKATRALR